jgi:hypothetical protein
VHSTNLNLVTSQPIKYKSKVPSLNLYFIGLNTTKFDLVVCIPVQLGYNQNSQLCWQHIYPHKNDWILALRSDVRLVHMRYWLQEVHQASSNNDLRGDWLPPQPKQINILTIEKGQWCNWCYARIGITSNWAIIESTSLARDHSVVPFARYLVPPARARWCRFFWQKKGRYQHWAATLHYSIWPLTVSVVAFLFPGNSVVLAEAKC